MRIIDSINHMGIVGNPAAVSVIADDVRNGRGAELVRASTARKAASARRDIEQHFVRRVRQSRIYQLASLMIIMWGALTFAGYLATYLSPRSGYYFWTAVYVVGIAGSFAVKL